MIRSSLAFVLLIVACSSMPGLAQQDQDTGWQPKNESLDVRIRYNFMNRKFGHPDFLGIEVRSRSRGREFVVLPEPTVGSGAAEGIGEVDAKRVTSSGASWAYHVFNRSRSARVSYDLSYVVLDEWRSVGEAGDGALTVEAKAGWPGEVTWRITNTSNQPVNFILGKQLDYTGRNFPVRFRVDGGTSQNHPNGTRVQLPAGQRVVGDFKVSSRDLFQLSSLSVPVETSK